MVSVGRWVQGVRVQGAQAQARPLRDHERASSPWMARRAGRGGRATTTSQLPLLWWWLVEVMWEGRGTKREGWTGEHCGGWDGKVRGVDILGRLL